MGAALDQIISVGLLLLLVCTALAFGAVEPWSIALFELSVVGLLVLWAGKAVAEGQVRLALPPITWPLLALVLFGLAQCIEIAGPEGQRRSLSLAVEATRLVVLLLFCMLLAMLLFANFLARHGRVQQVGHFLVFYGLLFAVFGVIQHFSWNGKFFWIIEPTRQLGPTFGSFVNRNHFAGYMEMMMPVPLALALLKGVQRDARAFYVFASVIMGVATIVSLSRGGMLSVTAGALFVVLVGILMLGQRRQRETGKRAVLPAVMMALAACILVLVIIWAGVFWVGVDPVLDRVAQTRLSGEVEKGQQTLYTGRGTIWEDTVKLIAAYPLTGVGLGAYVMAFTRFSKGDSAVTVVEQAHNDYLQILADAGVIGGALALWFLVALARSFAASLRHPQPELVALALGAGGGLVAMLVHSAFDFNLQIPSNALLFLLLAVIVSFIGEDARRPMKTGSNGLRLVRQPPFERAG